MSTFAAHVALLRGVNVGGAKRVPMAELRELLAALGYERITTLLNSGNAVFHAVVGTSTSAHAQAIAAGITARLKLEVPVIVKSAKELAAIVAENPLAEEASDPSRLLVVFAPDAAALASLAPIGALAQPPDRFVLGRHAAYLHCAGGILQSRAGKALLGRAGRVATTRNWATTQALHALAGQP